MELYVEFGFILTIYEELNNIEKEKENIDNKKTVNKKYCTECGKMIENEWAFCNFCGNKLK